MAYIDFPVTTNFMFSELIRTNVKANNVPADINVLFNMFESAQKLQVLRDTIFKCSIRVSSGYRSYTVNKLVGGVRTSDHLLGLAFDIEVKGLKSYDVYMRLYNHSKQNKELFGQVICYPSFVHVSFNCEKHKNEFFCNDLLKY